MAAEPAQTHATKHFGVTIGNRLASESVAGAPTPGPGVGPLSHSPPGLPHSPIARFI